MYEQTNTTPRAAVITPDRVFVNGWAMKMRADAQREPHSILAWVASQGFAKHSTVIVDGATVSDHAQHAEAVHAHGFGFSRIGPWTLYHRADGSTIAVGLRDAMEPPHLGVLVDQDQDPATLAFLLHRYHQLTGMAWRGTPATTALALLRSMYESKRQAPRWQLGRVFPQQRATGPLVWNRPLSELEQSWGYVHTFDATSAYLGSSGNAELAWSTLEHTGVREFDKHTPGYWLTDVSPALEAWQADPTRPPIVAPGSIRDGRVWLTTPMMQFLVDHGFGWNVVESWTAAEHNGRGRARIMREFSERLRDARTDTAAQREPLATAIKRTYKDATGGMQREGMRVYRPDWAHTLIDLWRATLLRRIIDVHTAQGYWPVAVKTDEVSYADCVRFPSPRAATKHYGQWAETLTDTLRVASCTVSGCHCASGPRTALGTCKHNASVTAEQWTAEHTPRVRAGAR